MSGYEQGNLKTEYVRLKIKDRSQVRSMNMNYLEINKESTPVLKIARFIYINNVQNLKYDGMINQWPSHGGIALVS